MSKRPRSRAAGIGGSATKPDDSTAKPDNAGNDGISDSGISEAITPTVDPATFIGEPAAGGEPDTQPRRGRGRPPGSGTGKSKTKALPLNLNGLEKLLVGIHGGLAMLTGRSEWSLDTEEKAFDGATEAAFYAKSIKDVADHYGSGMLDQKTLDWLNLIQCFAIIVGGRLVAIRMTPRAKPQRGPSQPAAFHVTPSPVNDFTPTMNGHDHTPATSGHVAGIGDVELPDTHPLSPNYKRPFN